MSFCSQTDYYEKDNEIPSSHYNFFKLVLLELDIYTLSPRNMQRLTSSRRLDATIIGTRRLHNNILTRFEGRGKKRTNVSQGFGHVMVTTWTDSTMGTVEKKADDGMDFLLYTPTWVM